jgi:hypothetical protein
VAAPAATDVLRAYFKLAPNSALVQASQPAVPPVVARPPTLPPGAPNPGPAAPPAKKYAGRLLGADGIRNEQPSIFGTIVDASGRGVAGVRVAVDKCDGNTVFSANSDGNGAFVFNGIYWHDATRWCVHTVAPGDSEPLAVNVEPYKRYLLQFVPTQ